MLTNNPRTLLKRLVTYLGADVEHTGARHYIHVYGAGMPPVGDTPGEEAMGMDTWQAIGRLLYVATMLEECGGAGCTWQGIKDAVQWEFMLRCSRSGCNAKYREGEGCPHGHDSGGDLDLPPSLDGTTEAMMSRLYAAAKADANADAALDMRAANEQEVAR
jgi:hypothetical protein